MLVLLLNPVDQVVGGRAWIALMEHAGQDELADERCTDGPEGIRSRAVVDDADDGCDVLAAVEADLKTSKEVVDGPTGQAADCGEVMPCPVEVHDDVLMGPSSLMYGAAF